MNATPKPSTTDATHTANTIVSHTDVTQKQTVDTLNATTARQRLATTNSTRDNATLPATLTKQLDELLKSFMDEIQPPVVATAGNTTTTQRRP